MSKKCCFGLAALIFLGVFVFVATMLAINLSDYASATDKRSDLISNYKTWQCYDLCGSSYSMPSGTDFCCSLPFSTCQLRSNCKNDLNNKLNDELSDDVQYIIIFGIATVIMLYILVRIAWAFCRGRSRQEYYVRQWENVAQSQNNYIPQQDIRQEPIVQPQVQQEENEYEGINGLRESFVCKDKENNCAICMDLLSADKVIVLTCMHMFHGECIRAWISKDNSCPVCRMPN